MMNAHDALQQNPRSPGLDLGRREFLALGLGAFVVGALPIAWLRRRGVTRRTLPVMGTLAEIAVVGGDERTMQAAIGAAFEELRRVDRLMSHFRADSDVGRANLGAFREAVSVSADTAFVLAESLRWAETTDGGFDPCLGRAIGLWNVGHRVVPPPMRDVRAVAGRRLYRALDLDRARSLARLHDRDARIDLGGIAKGYGVDRAVDVLRAHGVEHALVSAGGDLYALGRSADGDRWRVGTRRPDDPSRIRTTLRIADAGVATSGDYFQFFEHAGSRYHHLIDPRSGAPRLSDTHSVTVVAETCMQADAAATAVFGRSPAEAQSLLRIRAPGARVVA
jgi:thiamine biosynthesis lipoprotein